MRKTLYIVIACLFAASVVGSDKYQPLNIKTGQWQVTENYTVTGLPPGAPVGPRTITFKSCVTKEELSSNPFNDPRQKCSWKVLNSSPTDMEVNAVSCVMPGDQGTATYHFKLHAADSEHVNGSGAWSAVTQGMNINGNASGNGKWASATCSSQ